MIVSVKCVIAMDIVKLLYMGDFINLFSRIQDPENLEEMFPLHRYCK